MNRTTLCVLFCVLITVASLAQNSPACSPTGTWFGGGDYKYIITITPNADRTFAMRGEGAYSNAAFGYGGWTSFSSQFIPVTGKWYVSQGIAMYTTSSDPLPPPDSYELDAIRGWAEMTDCNHLHFRYDFFAAYFDLNKLPFVDPPDLNYLPPGGIEETYRRMPTTCPACNLPKLPSTLPRHKR